MWNRIALKEDSKSLLRLNYWPFVLVAFIHMIVSGSGANGIAGRSSRSGVSSGHELFRDSYYGYDEYRVVNELVRFVLPFLGLALVTALGM